MLTPIIGADAGMIWNLLSTKGRLSVSQLAKLTGYRALYLYLPLGWLSRENKILCREENNDLYVELS